MARFLLCLAAAAACCCCLALLPPPVQSRRLLTGGSRDHRLLFSESHFDAPEATEQEGYVQVKKKQATPAWSPPPPAAGAVDVVTPELRTVPSSSNPLHNGLSPTRQEGGSSASAAVGPELRWTPQGSNPLHNRRGPTRQRQEGTSSVLSSAADGSVVRPELRWTPEGATATNPLH